MRTAHHLYRRLCDPEYLEWAAAATVKGKRHRSDVAWFLFTVDQQLAKLYGELVEDRFEPSRFELVGIRDPKPRLIARLPIRDRVLHTAIVGLIEPVFSPSYSPDAYACRRGYGAHRAVLRLWELLQRFHHVLHLDIRSYFPSIAIEILLGLLARRLRDQRLLRLLERLFESSRSLYDLRTARTLAGLDSGWPPPGRGIPIGSYTSQLFAAQIYLNELDHFVKRELKVPGYLRYVDDLFFFGNRRSQMNGLRESIGEWLATHRALRLKHPRARVLACRTPLNALGYRIDREGLRVLPRALEGLGRRTVREASGSLGVDYERSLASTAGLCLY